MKRSVLSVIMLIILIGIGVSYASPQKASQALEKHVPPALSAQLNEHYDPSDPDALLDVFYPSAIADKPLPTIVWVHGGGWISGSKDDIANYGKVLAGKGESLVVDQPIVEFA